MNNKRGMKCKLAILSHGSIRLTKFLRSFGERTIPGKFHNRNSSVRVLQRSIEN